MARYIDPLVLDQAAANLGAANDEQLSSRLGMSSQAIRNMRQRRSTPSLESLVRIATAAGVAWEKAIITVADQTDEAA